MAKNNQFFRKFLSHQGQEQSLSMYPSYQQSTVLKITQFSENLSTIKAQGCSHHCIQVTTRHKDKNNSNFPKISQTNNATYPFPWGLNTAQKGPV